MLTLRLPSKLLRDLVQQSDMTHQGPYSALPASANPFAFQPQRHTMPSLSEPCHPMSRQQNTEGEGTLATTSEISAWMTYQPERSTAGDSYNNFLDELGFASNNADKRSDFVDHFKDHVDSSTFRYVRQYSNEVEFETMVLDFLRMYGLEYWGLNDRHHLQERDPNKGFLCPRDAQRSNSRCDRVFLRSEHSQL